MKRFLPTLALTTRKRLVCSAASVAGVLAIAVATIAFVVSLNKVPSEAIRSAVTRTPALIDLAWQLPAAATFKHELTWQSNPSTCGPASLANVFSSLGEQETTEGDVLASTGKCWLFGMCPAGLTLDEVADLARAKTHRRVTVLRNLTEAEFKEHLRKSNDPARRYIINFTRERIFGAGSGHHSPIGGYLEAEDLVFVLDVNRDFRPWLVESSRLFSAMDTLDGDKKRGLVLIE